MGWPIVRGVVNMGSMLAMGMGTLEESTQMLGILDEEPSKFEKWLAAKLGKGIDKSTLQAAAEDAAAADLGHLHTVTAQDLAIDVQLAEFVLDDADLLPPDMGKQVHKERGLPRPEKARKDIKFGLFHDDHLIGS